MRAAGLVLVIAIVALSAGCLQTFESPHSLHIVNLDIAPAHVLSQDVILNVTTVLDNRGGGDSKPVKLQAKAYSEDTGFLLVENQTTVGIVPGDTTRSILMQVKVPRAGSVRVDVAVFEDEQGQERASISARNLAALEPNVLDTGLRIRDVDFLVQNVTRDGVGNGTRVRVESDLYVTNEGASDSESLRIQVKAREVTTRLIADVQWLETGSIAAGSTVVRAVNLTVPDRYNYQFEILTWRGDVVVARNQGDVQLAPTFVKTKDQDVVTTNPNVNDFLQAPGVTMPTASTAYYPGTFPTPTPKVPGFEAVALVAAAAVALLLIGRRRA
ncbi:MAG: hypothetical protein WDA16_04055 [Candidatus Thermoplasmatota archaeon]